MFVGGILTIFLSHTLEVIYLCVCACIILEIAGVFKIQWEPCLISSYYFLELYWAGCQL